MLKISPKETCKGKNGCWRNFSGADSVVVFKVGEVEVKVPVVMGNFAPNSSTKSPVPSEILVFDASFLWKLTDWEVFGSCVLSAPNFRVPVEDV